MASRLLFAALLLGTTGGLTWLLAEALATGGWTILKAMLLLAFLPVAAGGALDEEAVQEEKG